ncbi:C2H2 type zinc finger domain protein [Aspergillus saccharolyticus JOP 1030-1]|uniref:C2H2 type zinc finger domain protein n=1 Tax=Aspergillus saccharolyticus JOP 1030-1 TaxID=1450539 RepID=A0A319A2V6_9EURO|nr:C2H2 type zinc finger domain protein [Aspergillus saccharolyticus JOP 1030-1]PYH41782.1 C2H2 type zinc finger domain protein [Aspergillus saccharolyticus JOP 1030-1]
MDSTSFCCPHVGCGRSYRRREHLNRHLASHVAKSAAACPYCDKSFTRNDTLRHHIRRNHCDKKLDSSRTREACHYCRSRRTRCDGQAPCAPCQQRGLACSLQSSKTRDEKVILAPPDSCGNFAPRDPPITAGPFKIRPYIDAYFEKFHPSWPFVHRPTLELVQHPDFLHHSVTMVGLWVTGDIKLQQAAMELHEKLSLSIYQQRDNWESPDPSNQHHPWPMATYQGILLNVIFALLTANSHPAHLLLTRTLPPLQASLLQSLVQTCRHQDMFFYPAIRTQFSQVTVPDVYVWLAIEEVKRFALALYRVCSTTEVDSPSRPCVLSLTELRFAMPEREELFDAGTHLAAMLAKEKLMNYDERNMEVNWISNSARLLCRDGVGFGWA